jgi:HlyD family type I secretion membrane fusion protein
MSESPALLLPRRCDTIASDAQRRFVAVAALGFLVFIGWAMMATVDKVKRGAGRVIPQMQNQTVQHLEGGIVTEILVREGDKVERGAALFRIENIFTGAELKQAEIDLKAKRARLVRQTAEVEGLNKLEFPADLKDNPAVIERETGLFKARAAALAEQQAILADQVRQRELELAESKSRWTLTTRERQLMEQRVENLRRLARVGGISNNELLDNERALQQIDTRLSDLMHDIPRLESTLSETRRRMNEVTLRFRSETLKERNETEVEVAKLTEAINAQKDRAVRTTVTAPVDGTVNKMFVTTVGGVVKSGEQLAQIVPADTSIAIEARLSPADRAEVWPGLPAVAKVSAYDFTVYGGVMGTVVEVSPDALTDEKGNLYYRVRLESTQVDFGPNRPILPGMMADVDILAGEQTILDIILRPVRKMRENALRQ